MFSRPVKDSCETLGELPEVGYSATPVALPMNVAALRTLNHRYRLSAWLASVLDASPSGARNQPSGTPWLIRQAGE
jgi:hypothetical protein